jgi:hypothetical protein
MRRLQVDGILWGFHARLFLVDVLGEPYVHYTPTPMVFCIHRVINIISSLWFRIGLIPHWGG